MLCFHRVAQKISAGLDFRNAGFGFQEVLVRNTRDEGDKQPLVGVTQVWAWKMTLKGGVF